VDRGWFEALFGFDETSPEAVRAALQVEGTRIRSLANGRTFEAGRLEIASLAALRKAAADRVGQGETRIEEWVMDAQALHQDPRAAGSLIQVASQFNLLEMVSPDVTPEEGVTGYVYDKTQGPACALAAAAGTVYRAHLHEVDGKAGQSADRQIDCLAGVGSALRRDEDALWEMRNGYALPSGEQLDRIGSRLEAMTEGEREGVRGALEIGLQWDTEVTLPGADQRVTQAYCSALPVRYSEVDEREWEPFGRLVLEGAYEATLAAGVLNAARSGNPRVFLTLLGGGAFGNPSAWILDAIDRALALYREAGLEVVFISYRYPNPDLEPFLSSR
jgi:hypothetical protein